ncbi:MAG: hypothetical protein ACOCYQ_07745 [Alkalispirochaeta sp.]
MRTTLDIDQDVLITAKEIARKEKKTAGQVISELARRGFYGRTPEATETFPRYRTQHGVPVLPPTGHLVTEETIRQIRDDEEI